MNNSEQDNLDNKAKKTGQKIGGKALRVIGKLGKHFVRMITNIILAVSLPVLITLTMALLTYFMVFEFTGTEKQYTKKYANETQIDDDGTRVTSMEDMNEENSTINDFYKYFASQSYLQIPINHKKGDEMVLIRSDHKDAVEDYYERETEFRLNENMLFTLDDRMYENWKYPEQFIKAVHFDEETLELKDLVDKDDQVVAESYLRDTKTGKKKKEKIESVRDYGLASVFKFQEGERNLTVEGTYVKEEYWDPETESVKTREINEDFEFQLTGFKEEKLHVIEKAITFVGEIEYKYEKQKRFYRDLKSEASSVESDDCKQYHYDTYIHEVCEQVENENGEMEEKCRVVGEYPLHKFRSPDSSVMEELPVVVDTTKEDKGDKYFNDYIWNFEAYIPEDALTDFDFKDRIDYDSGAFDIEQAIDQDIGFDLGSAIRGSNFKKAYRYFDSMEYWGGMYNVDPYLILAIATQESGGDPNVNSGGLMQIESNTTQITATNRFGQEEYYRIPLVDRTNPEKAIKFAAMRMQVLLDKYDGNVYKMIQEYNFGSGTMKELEKVSGDAWNDEFAWMIFRERARINIAPPGKSSASYGCMAFPEGSMPVVKGNLFADSCYTENVLRYYAGTKVEELDEGGFWAGIKGAASLFFQKFNKFMRVEEDEREEDIKMKEYLNHSRSDEPETIARLTNSLDTSVLYSNSNSESIIKDSLTLFDEGFIESMGSGAFVSMDKILEMAPNSQGYVPPVDMKGVRISSEYGPRKSPCAGCSKFHQGIDLSLGTGTPVYAIADGVVESTVFHSGGGNMLQIRHSPTVYSRYLHLHAFAVKPGQKVKQGEPVAQSGNTGSWTTGPHLHFELNVNGNTVNPKAIVLGE